MKATNRNLLACAIALALAAPAAAAPLFYQGFSICELLPTPPADCYSSPTAGGAGTYLFPAGWALRNVDNRTPDASVSYVNEAWEVREDFGSDVTNSVAFSTSYYSPVGQADDWMWTPAIAVPAGVSALSWRARAYDPAYPDGYEVRIMASPNVPTGGTGVIGNQLTSSTQVFSVAAEAATWTSHSVPLNAFGGQTVYVAFRNNSNDKFLLVVDDVAVIDSTPDAVAQPTAASYASPYARAPDGFSVDATPGFTLRNGGGVNLTNVIGSAQFKRNGAASGTPLQATAVPTLAVGAIAPAVFAAGSTFAGTGNWAVQYDVTAMESGSEANTANNTFQAAGVAISGNEFARWEGPIIGQLGIGAGNGGEMGEAYTLLSDTTVTGIRFGMVAQGDMIDDGMGNLSPNPFIGAPLVANLRTYDNTTPPGKPGALIDTTVAVTATTQGGVYDVAFVGGPHLLTAGTYVVTVSEPTQGTMSLPLHTDRFVLGATWVNWPTAPSGDWANLESFGSPVFQKMPEVSLLTETSIFKDGFGLPGGNRPGVQASQIRPAAPAPLSRKPAPTALSTKR